MESDSPAGPVDAASETLSTAGEGLSVLAVPADFRSGFVAIVGPANAGKSTLLNAIIGTKVSIVSPKQQTTRNRVTGIKTTPAGQIVFIDTPGFFAKRYQGELANFLANAILDGCDGADCVMLVCDAAEMLKHPELPQELGMQLRQKKIAAPGIIVLNKTDVCEKHNLLPLMAEMNSIFGEGTGAVVDILPVSARTGEGIEQLQSIVLSKLPVGPAYFPSDSISDVSDDFLASEIVREKLFGRLQQELPYSVAVRTDSWEDAEKILKIRCVILVEREAQKGIVIGEGGKLIKTVGTEARLELERIFQTKVFLELFVRVEPNWTKNPSGMRRAGYQRQH